MYAVRLPRCFNITLQNINIVFLLYNADGWILSAANLAKRERKKKINPHFSVRSTGVFASIQLDLFNLEQIGEYGSKLGECSVWIDSKKKHTDFYFCADKDNRRTLARRY